MAKLINLNKPKVADTKRLIKTHGTQTPLSSASIERGKTHWLNGSEVHIDGVLGIDGTATVTGTLNASGDINFSGTTEITGPLDITGATTIGGSLDVTGPTRLDGKLDIGGDTTITGMLDVTGPTAIKGTLGIEGVSTLKNDLNVTAGGKIKAGNVEIDPAGGGTIRTANATIADNGTYLQVASPNGLQLTAITTLISSPDVQMPSIPTKLGATANVHMDANGKLHRID